MMGEKVSADRAKEVGLVSSLHENHFEGSLDVSHLNVYIVSDYFESQSLLQRQRSVNKVLQPFFDQGLHAVQLNTKTPSEIDGQ